MHFSKLSIFALALGAIASPTPRQGYVRHERRSGGNMIKRSRADPSLELPVRIALAQNNMELGSERLLDISDPASPNFGKHLSSQEVGELFRPSSDSINAVRDWLHGSGIETGRHTVSPGKGWLKFHASVQELEGLLSTKYHVYEHSTTQESHIGCDEYHLPAELVQHIDFVTPSVSTIRVSAKNDLRKNKRDQMKSVSPGALKPIVRPAIGPVSNAADSNIPCYTSVTPACLRRLYGIPMGNSSVAGNEIGIFEDGDTYDQEDLDLTFKVIAPYVPAGTHPTLDGIDGGVAPVSGQYGIESLLDMSLIFPLIHPQQAILYQVDDLKEVELASGFGDTFLDALDASYCTFEGGDDPNLDPHYPDTGPNPPNEQYLPNGTWGQSEMCGAYTPTNVISMSYGLGEDAFSRFYEDRQCQEYMKLGLQGVSVIVSSGDSGVSNRGECIAPTNSSGSYDDTGAFSPSFPAACPWLTTVGATQFNDDDRTETAVAVPTEDYWSGGGFSNYWPAPAYQEATLANYFTKTPPPYNNLTIYGTPYYNKTGRGYPDVAAIGLNVLLYAGGVPTFVGGTSASAPIFASIITLINERRLEAGKSRVGFLNPTLYKNPQAFTDITTGSNPGCGLDGFEAVKGWDPVTGLGTPKFDKLLDVFMALP